MAALFGIIFVICFVAIILRICFLAEKEVEYRIIKITDANGEIWYLAQSKNGLHIWFPLCCRFDTYDKARGALDEHKRLKNRLVVKKSQVVDDHL